MNTLFNRSAKQTSAQLDQVKKISDMLDKGLISEEEFKQLKNEIFK